MDEREKSYSGNAASAMGQLRPYFLKSAAIIVALFALSRLLPMAPTWLAAIFLVALSIIPATGSVYRAVVNRTFRQKQFAEGTVYKGFVVSRIAFFVGFFALSLVSVGCILLESPKWGVGMWATLVLSIPMYAAVAYAADRFVKDKEKAIPLVRDVRIARIAVVATGALLCVVLLAISMAQPAPDYVRAADAFMAAPKPFENAPSVLTSEFGELMALVDGLSAYALAKLSEASWHAYVVLALFLNSAAMFGVAAMLSVCRIEGGELRRVFMELEREGENGTERKRATAFCVAFAVVPLLVVAGLAAAEPYAQDASRNDGYTFAKRIVKDQVSLIVYEFDGKYYDPDKVGELLARVESESKAISLDAEGTLVPLINASFDARIANVDRYLDWYYGLFTDWQMLLSVVTGSAEEFAMEQLETRIEEGIDDTQLNDSIRQCLERVEKLRDDTFAELSKYEVTNEYPSWLVKEAEPLDVMLETRLEPSQRVSSAFERIGISVAAGAVTGVAFRAVAKRIVAKVAAKAGFKAMASRIGGLVGASATAAGGPVAIAVSVVASLAADIALQKADEMQNRESYRQELVSAIEEQREEMLSAMRSATSQGMPTQPES